MSPEIKAKFEALALHPASFLTYEQMIETWQSSGLTAEEYLPTAALQLDLQELLRRYVAHRISVGDSTADAHVLAAGVTGLALAHLSVANPHPDLDTATQIAQRQVEAIALFISKYTCYRTPEKAPTHNAPNTLN